jgi:fucose permease
VTRRSEIAVVYLAGLVQGLALVTFPAASSVLTSPQYYGLSSTAYGALFLPQAITAVAASLAGAGLSGRLGIKRVFLFGLAADVLAMALLLGSQAGMAQPWGYVVLLLATTALGTGFGLTVPQLNTYAAAFFPSRVDRAVLMLNALLGLGTALAPLLAALFLALGAWWGLPLVVAVLLAAMLAWASRLPLAVDVAVADGRQAGTNAARTGLPARFWVFAGFALLYGMVETINGNWATVYMGSSLGATATVATLALTAFWGMVTIGRLLFAAVERRLPETRTFTILPFVAAAALAIIAALPSGDAGWGVVAFGLAGLGCSALLPLTISFGEQELTVMATAVAGGLFAFYQVGYGVVAFGVGPVQSMAGLSLGIIYGLAAGVALVMAGLSFVVVRGRPATFISVNRTT